MRSIKAADLVFLCRVSEFFFCFDTRGVHKAFVPPSCPHRRQELPVLLEGRSSWFATPDKSSTTGVSCLCRKLLPLLFVVREGNTGQRFAAPILSLASLGFGHGAREGKHLTLTCDGVARVFADDDVRLFRLFRGGARIFWRFDRACVLRRC